MEKSQWELTKKRRFVNKKIRSDEKTKKCLKIIAFGLIGLGAFTIVGTFVSFNQCKPDNIKWGEWRDTYSALGSFIGGAVTALWSLAGLILVYMGFLGQQNQIELQQIEIQQNQVELANNTEQLREQKGELEKSVKAQEDSAKQMQLQSELLRTQANILENQHKLAKNTYENEILFRALDIFKRDVSNFKLPGCNSGVESLNTRIESIRGELLNSYRHEIVKSLINAPLPILNLLESVRNIDTIQNMAFNSIGKSCISILKNLKSFNRTKEDHFVAVFKNSLDNRLKQNLLMYIHASWEQEDKDLIKEFNLLQDVDFSAYLNEGVDSDTFYDSVTSAKNELIEHVNINIIAENVLDSPSPSPHTS